MMSRSVDELLETLLDDIIELTGAARGVVLLVDPSEGKDSTPRVRVSRNVQRGGHSRRVRRDQRQHRASSDRDQASGDRQ